MLDNNLSVKQEQAISLMMVGKNDTEIGNALGVSRECVWRWRNENPDFIEAARKRQELMAARQMEELNDMLTEALMVVKENLRSGDGKTRMHVALQLLKMSGLQGFAKTPHVKERSEEEIITAFLEELIPEANKEIRMRYSQPDTVEDIGER